MNTTFAPHPFKKHFFAMLLCCTLLVAAAPNTSYSQTVVEISPMDFGIEMSLTTAQVITVDPLSAGAAGTPNTLVNLSIMPAKNRTMSTTGGSIKFNTIIFGGSVVDAGGTATGTLNALGQLNNVRVGGVIDLRKNQKVGLYVGTLTLRVVY